jgi:hypothetical protein
MIKKFENFDKEEMCMDCHEPMEHCMCYGEKEWEMDDMHEMDEKEFNETKEEMCMDCHEPMQHCMCYGEKEWDMDEHEMEEHEMDEKEYNEKKNWIQDAIKHPGALKKSLHKGKDEKISKSEINSELAKLKAKDKDKKKPGTQLNKKDATKKRRLELAKTLSKLKGVKEHNEEEHYMFFSNLETIKRLVDELLQMDKSEIDAMLKEHDWASDHITSSKDDIEEVFDFFAGNENPDEHNLLDDKFDNPMQHIDSFMSRMKK